ncbi:MAG: serine hydrolase domain-containing protein [Candidatus Sulfotelmatobacter sp.]
MTIRPRLFFSGLLVTLFTFVAPVQSQCDSTHLPTRFAEVASSARERVTKGELPSIAIAVAQHGRIACEEAFGWADREKKIPATPNTVYAAGSVAKAPTGTAIFMLVDNRKIRLDDEPEQYGVHVRADAGTGITVRQLLSMTAGIQHGWFYNYGSDVDTKELLNRYAIGAFPPGQHFIYSNFSYAILGEVVERAGKRPFREFMRDEVLNRLQMTSSGFNLAGRDVAIGYQAGKAVPPHTFEPEAGGGFYTSAHDLALFGLFQIDSAQKLIAPKLMKEMHTLETDQQIKSHYTSGWGVFNFKDGSSVLISDGVVLAGSATLLVLPKAGVVIACLTNTGSEEMDDLAFQFADLFSSGLLANLESARKEVEAREASRPFHADPSQLGLWVGSVDTPKGKLPVRVQITGDDHMQIGIDNGAMVPVGDLGIEEGFLSGGVAASLSLPETGNQPSKLKLQLLWVDGNRLIGTARTESTRDLPRFGLPVYVSLSRQK